jgi:hypothetical protein
LGAWGPTGDGKTAVMLRIAAHILLGNLPKAKIISLATEGAAYGVTGWLAMSTGVALWLAASDCEKAHMQSTRMAARYQALSFPQSLTGSRWRRR